MQSSWREAVASEATFNAAKMTLLDFDLKLFGAESKDKNSRILHFFDFGKFKASFTAPQNPGAQVFGIRPVADHGDLFPEFWFAMRGQPDAFHQPWYEFDQSHQVYKYHRQGAEKRILSRIIGDGKSIVLYRGTGINEGKVFEIFQKLRGTVLNSGQRLNIAAEIKSILATDEYIQQSKDVTSAFQSLTERLSLRLSYQHALNRVIASYANFRRTTPPESTAMIFMTPDLLRAQGWANPYILKIEIPKDVFERFARNESLYGGIEFGQYEVALASSEAIYFYTKNVEVLASDK